MLGGNHTKTPEPESPGVPLNYDEDQLLPRMPDARGHARNIRAPGGWVARCDKDGKKFELYSIGFRNQYDIAFNADGEMFTYDSDMEWDSGTPWYRPTRLYHVTSGSEFGWRTGTGKWPVWYPDALPPARRRRPGFADRRRLRPRREVPRQIPGRDLRLRLDLRHHLRDAPHAGRCELPRDQGGVRRRRAAATSPMVLSARTVTSISLSAAAARSPLSTA